MSWVGMTAPRVVSENNEQTQPQPQPPEHPCIFLPYGTRFPLGSESQFILPCCLYGPVVFRRPGEAGAIPLLGEKLGYF